MSLKLETTQTLKSSSVAERAISTTKAVELAARTTMRFQQALKRSFESVEYSAVADRLQLLIAIYETSWLIYGGRSDAHIRRPRNVGEDFDLVASAPSLPHERKIIA